MTAPAEPATGDTASYQLKRFSEAADKIRANAGTAAKTLGGVGSAVVAAVGVAKFSDILPLPGRGWSDGGVLVLLAVTLVGFGAMGWAVLALTGKLWLVGEPVFTTADPAEMDLADHEEKRLVKKAYRETVKLNFSADEFAAFTPAEKSSLKAYEQRAIALELDAEADGLPPEERAVLRTRATAIRTDIRATQARAAALVVRTRAAKIGKPGPLYGFAALFAAGLVASSLCAGELSARRTSELESTDRKVATVKACADAVEALTKNKITLETIPAQTFPAECPRPEKTADTPQPSPAAHRAETTTALINSYRDCLNAATGKPDSCAWILTIIKQSAG
ncbi:hypothetical protein ACWEIJ_25235 [Lentzea sp. NPDC004789]